MKYTRTHEWISVEGKTGTVGITRHAVAELGDVIHVELPKVGRTVKVGEEVCVLESAKAAADTYAPVSGKILAINEALKTSPETIGRSPEAEGWLYRIELSHPKELDSLLTEAQYKKIANSE